MRRLLFIAVSLTLLPLPAAAEVVWYDGFEGRSTPWKVRGSSERTDAEAWKGKRSLTFSKVAGNGDALSHPIRLTPGETYYVHLAYLTRGGGGYLGVEQLDENGRKLTARWLIGDGGCCTEHSWAHSVADPDESKLGLWEARTVRYDNPSNVHFVRLMLEDWSGGLPDDPVDGPVFFDSITISTTEAHTSGCEDPDGDGHCAGFDNCRKQANPLQRDRDRDTIGDACDPDADGDGLRPPHDCDDQRKSVRPGAPERCDDVDSDCDGSLVDEFPDVDGDGRPECDQLVDDAVIVAADAASEPVAEAAPEVTPLPAAEPPPELVGVPAASLPGPTPAPPAGYIPEAEYVEPTPEPPARSKWPWLLGGASVGVLLMLLPALRRERRPKEPVYWHELPEDPKPPPTAPLH